ncbi:MAG: hypothetical protein K0U93_08005 [Gammaproteobacteria bacterium]|nr:hypothetical protein [Gammaproteobacteria bacterium]
MSGADIGIDLDNTIINYDRVFAPVAEAIGLLPSGCGLTTKEAVKQTIRDRDGDEAWMRLQGQVYGRYIGWATPHVGCEAFIRDARERGARVVIVSHKTRLGHFDPAGVDLWDAARTWLDECGFFSSDGPGIDRGDVHFEITRQAKVERIAAVGCDVFIDDLPEVLTHRDFPEGVRRIWFAPGQQGETPESLRPYAAWSEIAADLLERSAL